MIRRPSSSTRNAPSPRTASEISGCWPCESSPSHITVGWNCTNSRSRSGAPARSASAIPSPVATAGLVVWENTWPSPPLASTTARHSTWPDAVDLALAEHVQGHPRHAAVGGGHQVDRQRVLDHLDLGGPLDRGDQRPLDLGAGRVAAGVGDAVAVVAALAGQRQDAVVLVEHGAPADQLADRLRPLVDQDPYRLAVAGPRTGDQGVLLVLLRGCRRGRAPRRCRPAPTAWNPRRARPWSPRGSGRPGRRAAARR